MMVRRRNRPPLEARRIAMLLESQELALVEGMFQSIPSGIELYQLLGMESITSLNTNSSETGVSGNPTSASSVYRVIRADGVLSRVLWAYSKADIDVPKIATRITHSPPYYPLQYPTQKPGRLVYRARNVYNLVHPHRPSLLPNVMHRQGIVRHRPRSQNTDLHPPRRCGQRPSPWIPQVSTHSNSALPHNFHSKSNQKIPFDERLFPKLIFDGQSNYYSSSQ